jgi:hypothetical protein
MDYSAQIRNQHNGEEYVLHFFLAFSLLASTSHSHSPLNILVPGFQSLRQSSLLSAVGVTSTQEMLLKLTSLEALSKAMRKAGLESSNLIFGTNTFHIPFHMI